MSNIRTSAPDPTWEVELRQRKAVLWIGESAFSDNSEALSKLFRKTWQAVIVDRPGHVTDESTSGLSTDEGFSLRHYTQNAGPESVPDNRLPVYWLRSETGDAKCGDASNPSALMARFEKLKRIPSGLTVFVVGESNTEALREAANISSDAFGSIVFITSSDQDLADETSFDRFFIWETTNDDFLAYVNKVADQSLDRSRLAVLVKTPATGGRIELDVSACVDQSHPITKSFDFVSADAIIEEVTIHEQDVRSFLSDPTSSWKPYKGCVPWPRYYVSEYKLELLRRLKRFDREGPSMTCTGWIPSEDGAGTTTTLRQLAFDVAAEGYPVLVAKSGMDRLDFKQLAAFLSATSDVASNDERIQSPFPWVIMFDAEQTSLLWDALRGLANGLQNLNRSAVIVLVRHALELDSFEKALGTNRTLGDELKNKIKLDESLQLGEHFRKFLPNLINKTEQDWKTFIDESGRTYDGNAESLFWVALRFWLLPLEGSDGSFREWLSGRLHAIADRDLEAAAAILEIAALAKHRIQMPVRLLPDARQQAVRNTPFAETEVLGLRRLDSHRRITIAHPFVAEEVLRIAMSNGDLLTRVGLGVCISPLELELHLVGEILKRPYAADEECLLLIEELVTSALRVDPRQNPRTYPIRDRVVEILENANESIWDTSQVFNHHVAKARRHLAIDPPSGDWSLEARREQLVLATKHIEDALHNVRPQFEEHEESELNLLVSLALTYSGRSKLERFDNRGDSDLGDKYEAEAARYYEQAQQIDADNSHLLENFARHKIHTASSMEPGDERTRVLVEAIHLLELEQYLDDHGFRIYQTTEELAKAYSMLKEDEGFLLLESLADDGFEPAIVALAKIRLQEPCSDDAERNASFADAEKMLRRVDESQKTWRSQLTLYRVVSELRPNDFVGRLEILDTIEMLGDEFSWPQQLRLEHAILLLQAGNEAARQRGKNKFKSIRDQLISRSSWLDVPNELKYLRDPASEFKDTLKTHIVVKDVSGVGKSSFAIPDGWRTVDVVFRAHRFPRDRIRKGDELDCVIQFTTFGPQAIPLTSWEATKGE